MKTVLISVFLLLCGGGASYLQSSGSGSGERPAETSVPPPSPQADLVVALLGGFRGIAAEIVWFRADRLQDYGRYAELAQLATWLTFLEPRTPEVWSYSAWNLAYNISVMMPDSEDRWRWVEAGLKLLRDDGLRLNPRSAVLRREIAWLFLAKIGGSLDDAAPYYREVWKKQVETAEKSGDWTKLKLIPEKMAEIDADYGKQDWKNPFASALYWAKEGLEMSPSASERRELRQILVQTMMLESLADPKFAPRALAEMRTAYAESPSPGMADMIERFRIKFSLKKSN